MSLVSRDGRGSGHQFTGAHNQSSTPICIISSLLASFDCDISASHAALTPLPACRRFCVPLHRLPRDQLGQTSKCTFSLLNHTSGIHRRDRALLAARRSPLQVAAELDRCTVKSQKRRRRGTLRLHGGGKASRRRQNIVTTFAVSLCRSPSVFRETLARHRRWDLSGTYTLEAVRNLSRRR
jgi:hypothetical protein